jgi:hypothetical protein
MAFARRRPGLLLLAALCVAVLSAQRAPHGTRVLFIGNSYTYFNNLPAIFARLAEAAGAGPVEVGMVAPGGMRLSDHWTRGDALPTLRGSRWDVVVLQDQSTLGVGYYLNGQARVATDELFAPFADRWVAEVKHRGARPILYLTWARKATPEDQAALNRAYGRAARRTRAEVAPVGIAWASARELTANDELYVADGSHPAPAGSYLAACTLVAAVFGRKTEGLPGRIAGPPVDPETGRAQPSKTVVLVDLGEANARLLQRAAWDAIDAWQRESTRTDDIPLRAPLPPPLPAPRTREGSGLAGTWRGTLLLHPSGPREMTLRLGLGGGALGGSIELARHALAGQAESAGLVDVHLDDGVLTFVDQSWAALDNVRVLFRGVLSDDGELTGTARGTLEQPNAPPVQFLGTWRLTRTE